MTLLDLPPAPAPSRPKGEADDWTSEEIAALALLLLSDADQAALLWASLAPRAFRRLLTAEPLENVRGLRGPFPSLWFDVQTQRYGTGTLAIRDSAIRSAVEAVRAAAEGRARAAVAAVYAGDTEIGIWQNAIAQELKLLALAIHAAGVGGIGRLTAQDLVAVSKELLFQLTRLLRFARHIERGLVTPPAAERRAAAYPSSVITGEFESARRMAHVATGFTLERNILDPEAEHCTGGNDVVPDCPTLTEKGWVKIGTMPPPGKRRCLWNCRCRMDFAREE